ncbi:MAG: outer membrane lipoprotein carrier protein LolA [bacterium]|nr:outer membrane lipoprotein carrier protein LolA [bacterium]
MKRIFFLFWLVLLCTMADQAAFGLNGQEVVGRMQKRFQGLKTLSASFMKRHYWKLMDQTHEIKGRLFVQRPHQFRLDTKAQTVVTDGKTAWNYAPANGQVLVSDYEDVKNDKGYEKLLFDLILLGGYSDNYVPQYVGEEKVKRKTCHLVELASKQKDTYIYQIRLWVDKKMWLVRRVEYRNIHDDVTTFELSDLKVDKQLKADRFRFHIPKGVELVDLR